MHNLAFPDMDITCKLPELLGNQEPHHYKHVEQMRTSTFDLLR